MVDLISFYSTQIDVYRQKVQGVKKLIFYASAGRLTTFILLAIFTYLFSSGGNKLYLAFGLISLIAFLLLVKKSNTLSDKKSLLENLLLVNDNEFNVLKGERNNFDNGQQFLSNESYLADLDVFGEASLFHLINRTNTFYGTSALAHLLRTPFTDHATIAEYQEAVKAFTSQHSVHEQIMAYGLLNKNNATKLDNIEHWLKEPAILLSNKLIGITRYVVPALNLIALVIYLLTDNYLWLTLTVVASWIHVGIFSRYINKQHLMLGKKQQTLEQYSSILEEFTKTEIRGSSILNQNVTVAKAAYHEVRRLSSLANLLDQRLNLLVNILLNSFLLYDIQCMIALERWKVYNKENFASWINCVSTIEGLTSLSKFAFNHPTFCYPTLTQKLLIEAEELAHPLIPENERIPNNISIGRTSKLLLITGSNMSGKTTFLRTIGINTLLAQVGAPVCAKSFSFSPVNIYTSIRISDSLQEHTSYFMAELKRLSEIKERLSSMQPSLVLIDEILRGTNSDDKYYGSAEFVKKLIQYNCLTLFATHDLKLSQLEIEYSRLIENYCFESIIENNELKFDYKILRGVAQNKNASFLMKKMEII